VVYGLDLETSVSGAFTSIANVDSGVGDTIGSAGNLASSPDGAKLLLCFGMYVGRHEVLTVYVLPTPAYWRGVAEVGGFSAARLRKSRFFSGLFHTPTRDSATP